MKRSLKYRILLKAFGLIPVKKIMAQPPEKTQEFFKKMDKGANIPKLQDPEFSISKGEVNGFPVLYVKHREKTDKLMFYLIGGGMLKYPKPSQGKEVLKLAKECGVDVLLPYYPTVFTGKTLPDVYAMLYALYKKALRKYRPEDICFAGGSSGGNLAIGLISYINHMAEGIPVPGKIYAGSPGTLLLTEEEKQCATEQEKTDVIMSVTATENIWEGMTGGKEVPAYMKYLQLGDYTGLKDAYLSFGGDEVFLAGAKSIKKRLEEYGAHVTLEVGEGLYHSYAMLPIVKEAENGYRNFKNYIREKTILNGDKYCDDFTTGDKEKVCHMVNQVISMTSSEMEAACRQMADAFLDYDWTDGNLGMCEYLDREHFYRFTRGYFELALRNGSLYCAGEHGEGYMIFETPQTKGSFVGSMLQIKGMLSAYGFSKAIKQVREIMQSGRFLAMEMKKEKKPFVKIEFIAVTKDFQKQGYMRHMIDFAFSEADRLGLPCILTTDDRKKVAIYEHFGMKMVKEHILAKNAVYYEMLRDKSIMSSVDSGREG